MQPLIAEQTITINLSDMEDTKGVKIRANLPEGKVECLTQLQK